MKSVNTVTLIGNLGADPEHKTTPQGTAVATFNMATNKKWTDKQTGEKKEKVDWHRVVLWKGLADIAAQYLTKGSPVYIQGELSQRSYEDKETGQKKFITEIVARDLVLIGGNGGGQERPGDDAPEITDEDIPF
jgi:single-strand DNA-binding protein